ncbi:ATP-binding protein [Domibacillus enclensis]|uniref:histidine kinase n=1 Tax=Domibacillus enclensis TaxID=1017273 RepID=A0A1N6TRM7_9BACI|nr:ATP-binding protein [Domibacillus enclensis]OXS78341.1 PAS domain-containing sensor histidine kinase [Domibacillus enclensis]SIQ56028.1 two-component system, sporulation sensor kinase A/two-component system, sporulation sensor kinase E [Domibacillus enclensis]
MIYTGRLVTVSVCALMVLVHLLFFEGEIKNEAVINLAAFCLAYFLGWQYDRIKIENKRTEEGAESYKQLVELLPDAVFIHEGETILYVNKAGEKLLGASQNTDLIGKSIYQFIKSDYQQLSLRHIQQVYRSKVPVMDTEKELITLDGRVVPCGVSSLFMPFQGREALLSIVKDLTIQKAQTAQLVEKSEKLALVGQLAAGIAHEIRNPLTSIRGFLQLSHRQGEHRDDYFEIMITELDRINLIVSELLGVSKPVDVVYKKQAVTTMLEDVVALIQSQALMDNVQIHVNMEPDMPLLYCEENQLKQVFLNVLKNGIEAMPDGGTIQVEMKRIKGFIQIQVKDEGSGISAEHMPKLGEPFYTTKEKGTGLGLMTCMKIIDSHCGELNISSEKEKGTTVEIKLPVA